MHTLRLKAAESFLETKSGLRDVKRADFIRYWRRSALKIQINRRFLQRKTLEIIRTTSFIRFWPRSGLTESGLTEVYGIYLFIVPVALILLIASQIRNKYHTVVIVASSIQMVVACYTLISYCKMKLSHSVCGPHEVSDIILGLKAFPLDTAALNNILKPETF